jgi:hypothetical protein
VRSLTYPYLSLTLWMTLSLVSSLHVPCGKYDTWNTPGESYIDYRTLAVFPFATSRVNRLSSAVVGMDF